MVPLRDVSIRKKLIIIIMVVSTGSLFLSFGGFLAYDLMLIRQETVRETSTIARIIGNNCTAALVFADPSDARKVLSSLRLHPCIVGARIFSKDGRPFAGYVKEPSPRDFASAQLREPGHYFEGETLTCYEPIFLEDAVIGTVAVESDLGIMYNMVTNQMIVVALLLCLSALCALLASSKLERLITRPILALTDLTRMVSRKKDYSMRGTVMARDETGVLAENFNGMLAEIEKQNAEIVSARQKAEASEATALRMANETKSINEVLEKEIKARRAAEQALKNHQHNLEKLVAERTSRLVEANARLSREINDRKTAEQGIKESLEEKRLLLGEIHHRVKNNLQVISNLLDMTRRRTLNRDARMVLSEARSRIHTMAMIHSQLYESDNFNRIDMKMHIKRLLAFISQMYRERGQRIFPIVEGDPVHLSVTQAVPCALVLTELISNAFKHAYAKDEEGQLRITLSHSEDGHVNIRIQDHGQGFPKGIDIDNTETLGLKLARNLIVMQLRGEFEVIQQEGTEIVVDFPIDHDDLIVH